MIETAWRLVGKTARWRRLYEQLRASTGHKKKAIVGVARRLLAFCSRCFVTARPTGRPPSERQSLRRC